MSSSLKLNNLIAIVDDNGFRMKWTVKNFGHDWFGDKWDSFGWNVCSVDGHKISDINNALNECNVKNKPKAIIAHTIKGKVVFGGNNNEWHHNRLTEEKYKQALGELGEI